MRPSLIQPLWLALGLVVINLVMFLLLTTTLRPWLDDFVTDRYDEVLQNARSSMQHYFSSSTAANQQGIADALSKKLNSRCSIVPANRHNFSEAIMKRLRQPAAQQGLIDPVEHFIYYPLGKDHVAVLDPPPYPRWLMALSRDLHWILAVAINILLVYFYLRYRERRWSILEREIMKLPGMASIDNREQDIVEKVRQLNKLLADVQEEHGNLLLLQRDLLHGVAHEFRSPMARIQFALEMTEDADEAEQADLRAGIHQALNDLDKLVQELLYYARLKDSRSELDISSVKLMDLLASCMDHVSPFYPGIRFDLNADDPGVVIQADERLMKRMLLNLLRNAGRFAQSQCRIAIRHTEDRYLIRIEDDGSGVPPGKVKRIFEPFTRLDPSRSRDSGGCGLGLAVVDSIVRKHGWRIIVGESDLGGACFEVEIPGSMK
ncbi:ATP-binding protein [Thiolapillus brandeum]|uniref:histidine kinase n=1 Tax=Thiolapillus brandeum TaxID=1076588 RepID=A0A7U6GL55_9GAMM|nr:ATP-binding protein [Thiolapillus brandeum]BAO45688.1 two-component system OmpR family sensor histidine kinase RstB [Thiolapillus brandeum]